MSHPHGGGGGGGGGTEDRTAKLRADVTSTLEKGRHVKFPRTGVISVRQAA